MKKKIETIGRRQKNIEHESHWICWKELKHVHKNNKQAREKKNKSSLVVWFQFNYNKLEIEAFLRDIHALTLTHTPNSIILIFSFLARFSLLLSSFISVFIAFVQMLLLCNLFEVAQTYSIKKWRI